MVYSFVFCAEKKRQFKGDSPSYRVHVKKKPNKTALGQLEWHQKRSEGGGCEARCEQQQGCSADPELQQSSFDEQQDLKLHKGFQMNSKC
ncbi:hypothetical protein E3N88_05257 [Mikania micrantha]|uniref:Uncharacterized protein n=1 Tax=Mikania micrantha TaxID=192012 RepID=A0A5N6PWU5_9ASTR|nr:hypothetical protein E3N88_05257 [Mikania micrantha]